MFDWHCFAGPRIAAWATRPRRARSTPCQSSRSQSLNCPQACYWACACLQGTSLPGVRVSFALRCKLHVRRVPSFNLNIYIYIYIYIYIHIYIYIYIIWSVCFRSVCYLLRSVVSAMLLQRKLI